MNFGVQRWRAAAAGVLMVLSGLAQAQVQRTFVNLGFELPSAAPSNCYFQVSETLVPGWTTNHPTQNGVGCAPNVAQTPGPLIEIWRSGYGSVAARSGSQFAELNAQAASRIYQNVCLANGELVGWRFSHRGRQSATTNDVTEFRVGSTANTHRVVRAGTQNDGGGGVQTCYGTTTAGDGNVRSNSCTSATASNGWRDYSGSFTWQGTTGTQAIGFEAISAAGGATIGNFIDDIQMTLRPFVELTTAAATVREGASNNILPALRVAGTVPAGGISVQLTINGGTAVRGSDYNTTSGTNTLTVSVPAGVYDGNDFALPLALIDDSVIEDNETITLAITSSPSNYVLSSTQTCGAPPITATSITLRDNDVDLASSLTADRSSALGGESVVYTYVVRNNTARPTSGDATSHDAALPLSLPAASGLTFTSWTCTASGGAQCPGGSINGTVTGSGAISGTTQLPAGNAAAGGQVSYTITAAISPTRCTAVTQTASVTAPAGLAEGTSLQSGFVSPVPGGSADNSATHTLSLSCLAALSISKTDNAATYTPGGTATYVVDIGNTGPSTATALQLSDNLPAGLTLSAAPVCSTQGSAVCGTVSGSGGGTSAGLSGATLPAGSGHGLRLSIPVNVAPGLNVATLVNLASASSAVSPMVTASDSNARPNQAPVAQAASVTVAGNGNAAITLQASDPDGDALTFHIVTPPAHGTLSGSGATLTYTPNSGYTGSDSFSFRASDGSLDSAPASISLTITAANRAPSITSTPPLSVNEGATYAYDVDASDPDAGDTLSYSLLQSPAGMTINAASGAISWPADASGWAGNNLLPNPRCETGGGSASQSAAAADVVFVVDESESMNIEHAWIGDVAGPLQAHLAARGVGAGSQANRYGLVGFEAYPRPLTVGSAPLGSYEELITATGQLRLSGGIEDGWRALDHVLRQYSLRSAAARNLILITDEDRDAADTTLTYAGMLAAVQDAGLMLNAVVDARFSCGDGSAALGLGQGGVGYKADGFGGFSSCSGATAGTAEGTTVADYVDLALATGGAAWDLDRLREGGATAQSFTAAVLAIKVREILSQVPVQAQADLYIHALALVGDQIQVEVGNRGLAAVDAPFSVQVSADGQPVGSVNAAALAAGARSTYSLAWSGTDWPQQLSASVQAPAGLAECKADNNSLAVAGVRVRAADGGGLYDQQSFTLSVHDANAAPQIVSSAPLQAAIGGEYRYAVQASDADRGDALSYQLDSAPAGMQIDARSGGISFIPAASQLGSHTVTLSVTDLAGASASQSYTLTVGTANPTLYFTSTPPWRLVQGTQYQYQTTVAAAPDAVLSYDVFLGPPGFAIDASSGAVSWQVPADFAGEVRRIVLRVKDQHGNYALQSYNVYGDWPSQAPVFTSAPTLKIQHGREVGYFPWVTDANVRETFSWHADRVPPGVNFNTGNGQFYWTATASTPSPVLSAGDPLCLEKDPAAASFTLATRWTASVYAIGTPLIGPIADTNGDGGVNADDRIAVVAIDSYHPPLGAAVTAYNAETGKKLWAVNPRPPQIAITPAMADLDGSGAVSILYIDTSFKLVALDGRGALRWVSSESAATHLYGGENELSLADLDGDGQSEILYGGTVFNADGSLRFRFAPLPYSSGLSPALALDLDGDGQQEVLFGREARRADGSLLWQTPAPASGQVLESFFAPARLSGGAQTDVVVADYSSAGNRLMALRADGSLIWQVTGAAIEQIGPPLVADFADPPGDEIFLASAGQLFSADGQALWSIAMTPSIRRFGDAAVAADLDADGRLEIIALRDAGLRIISGQTGALLSYRNGKSNYARLPVFADPRRDGRGFLALYDGQLRLFGPGERPWPLNIGAANQLIQAADRSRSDMTVPPAQPNAVAAALGVIGPVQAVATPTVYFPDLWISAPTGVGNAAGLAVKADVINRGSRISQPAQARFYRGSVQAANLIGEMAVPALMPGKSFTATLPAQLAANFGDGEVIARIDAAPGEPECETGNNQSTGRNQQVSVTDHAGLITSQSWVMGIDEPFGNLSGSGTPPATAQEGQLYTAQLQGISPYVGDAMFYSLDTAPPGASVDPLTGLVRWTPAPGQIGTFAFFLQVMNLNGQPGQWSWNVTVSSDAANTPPQFVSTPLTGASLDQPYRYFARADDAEGHPITYSLASPPAGMVIDSETGQIDWLPTSATPDRVAVSVVATDVRNAASTQNFELRIYTTPNQSPVFSSTPALAATVGTPYQYLVTAGDPDGDPLQFIWREKPDNASIGPLDEINWTPAANQLGAQRFEVEVRDDRGAWARQRFDVVVSAANVPPQIDSTPGTSASTGVAYHYAVEASDADGDTLAYSLVQQPSGMQIDAVSGVISWTPTLAQAGTHDVEVAVSDGRGGRASQTFTVAVTAPNAAPQISSTPPATAEVDALYTYAVVANDSDGDALSYALTQNPTGMQIDAGTGVISWTPATGQGGSHPVQVSVSDGRGGTATQSFSVQVGGGEPVISSTPPTTGKAGRAYRYDVIASDPDNDTLVYSLSEAPQGMTINSATGRIDWTPATASSTPLPVRVRVSDGVHWVEQGWDLTVLDASVPFTVDVSIDPESAAPGGPIDIMVLIHGAAGGVIVAATLDGDPVTLAANGSTTLTAPTTPGIHTITVSANDGTQTVTTTATFGVADPNDADAPMVQINSPGGGSEITMPVAVRATVQDVALHRWSLHLRPAHTTAAGQLIASGTNTVTDAVIGQLDPTLLMNDQYELVLQAWDTSGRRGSHAVVVLVTGEMKIGHFSITLEEVNLPFAGIPIYVTRTYDTRRRNEKLDFGQGWSIDYQNVRLRESQAPGYSWTLQQIGTGLSTRYCVRSNGPRTVTVTLPDGDVETFQAKAYPECSDMVATLDVELRFEPVGDTQSTLRQDDHSNVRIGDIVGQPNAYLFDLGNPDVPVDPSHYTLTTADGMVYTLDQGFGVQKITDPSGNSLTYSASGIVHSTGTAVGFTRDTLGRITRITLPDETYLEYFYDANGDLVSNTDALRQPTDYVYYANKPHFLKDIEDARGIRIVRNEYDDDGRLVATIDADDQRVEYTHDIVGRTERVLNRRGHATLYTYNDAGFVLTETNALGKTTSHTYDPDGNELTRTDPLGHTTTWTYDARGNKLTEVNHLGQSQRWAYNARNKMTVQYSATGPGSSGPEHAVQTNTYLEPWGVLQQSTDALGNVTQFRHDHGPLSFETGELREITDANGASTVYGITRWGWPIWVQDAYGHRVNQQRPIATGRLMQSSSTRTHADGTTAEQLTAYTYDDKGRVLTTTQPDGSVSTTVWNAIDKPEQQCTQQRCTLYAYDDQGRPTRTTYPNGTWQEKAYDANGNVVAETDTEGRTTKFVFDAADRRTETIFPDGTPGTDADNPRTRTVYDDAGRLEMSLDENNNITSYDYDDAGRQISTTNALGKSSLTIYDADGRRIAITDAAGRTTKFVYDLAGRLTETIHPDAGADDSNDANNPRTRADYDAVGRKVADYDESGRITRFAYDKLGRLIAVFLPDPATGANPPLNPVTGNSLPSSPHSGVLVTRYAYDEVGNKLTQTDATGNITTWRYDNAGRVLSRELPLGQTESFQYDSFGRRSLHTDFRGRATGYSYQANTDWLSGIDYATQADVSLLYTPGGELREVQDGNGTTTYTRDTRGRLLQVAWPQRPGMSAAPTVSYEYDAAGNRTRLSTANQVIDYSFDALNRLAAVTPQGATAPVATYSYDDVGNRASLAYDNGTATTYAYNRRNRLTGIQHKAGAALLLGVAYTLDPSGLRTGIEETGAIEREATYTYDAVKRLTSESVIAASGDRRTSWVYDKTGNRLTQVQHVGPLGNETGTASTAYLYDANDRLSTETTTLTGSVPTAVAGLVVYTYDAAGNTTRKVSPAATIDYRYDDANRLAEFETLAGEVTRYAYNHNGIRISQTSDATGSTPVTTHYLIDPVQAYAQVIEESTQQGSVSPTLGALYTFGNDRIRQLRPASGSTPAGLRYYHADGLGSTRLLSDDAGAATDHYAYHAFGEIDGQASQQNSDNDFLFTGEQLDPSSGFYYLRARYLSYTYGRFIQQDSFLGFEKRPASLHKYFYADADSVNKTDPSGHMSMGEANAAQSIQGNLTTLATRAGKMLNAYDRVNSIKDLTIGLVQLFNFVTGMSPTELASAWPTSAPSISFSDAADVFVQESRKAIGTGIGDWGAGYVTSSTKGSKLTAYVIYMPTFGPLPSTTLGTGFKINGNEIKLGFGGPGGKFGSLSGVGVVMGSERQLYRMDYHPFNPGHGGALGVKENEIAVWQRDPYHLHVYKWHPGGPR